MELNEGRLIQNMITRKRSAWDYFLYEYGPIIYRTARAVLSHSNIGGVIEAEDVAQRVLGLLVENDFRILRSFQGRSTFATWLIAITRKQALMLVRQENRRNRWQFESEQQGQSIQDNLERQKSIQNLRSSIVKLPPRMRLLITLYYIDGLSYEEISSILHISPNSVSPFLERARQQLREKLVLHEKGHD